MMRCYTTTPAATTEASNAEAYRVPGCCDALIEEALAKAALEKAMSPGYHAERRKTLAATFAEENAQLVQLRLIKTQLDRSAERFPRWVMYGTFAFLSLQFAVLFNWVFFVFDWNLVEPVTYFLGYTVVWLSIVLFAVTGREFTYDDVMEMLREHSSARLYKKHSFDLEAYTKLETRVAMNAALLSTL